MSRLVKICGLVRAEDVALATGMRADLFGFVRHAPSPRHCADLSVALPVLDRAVLVMVAETGEEILELVLRHGFRRVQPHLPAETRAAGVRLLRGSGLSVILPWADEAGQEPIPADLYLWEPGSAVTGGTGGCGLPHAMVFPPPGAFLLAGGLEAANLKQRVAALPDAARASWRGVDAASRLESRPGEKDPAKVAAFIHAARALEVG